MTLVEAHQVNPVSPSQPAKHVVGPQHAPVLGWIREVGRQEKNLHLQTGRLFGVGQVSLTVTSVSTRTIITQGRPEARAGSSDGSTPCHHSADPPECPGAGPATPADRPCEMAGPIP